MSRSGRPNVLLIMADQLAAGWLPPYGHHVVSAPAVTGLAAQATTFDAAYCAFPLCAPSRAALLTGRRASRVGVYDNAAELAATVPTVTHHLRAAGYHTCLAGKMHFVGPDQLHGFEQRLTPDVYPAGVGWTPDWSRAPDDPLTWYHSMESVLTPARTTASMQTDYDDEVAFHAVRHLHDLARGDRDQPFFMVVSFTNPHDPWEIPPVYWDRYDTDAIALPAVESIPLESADPHSRRLRAMYGVDAAELTDAQIRRARHAYYSAISYVDDRIGLVLDALATTGLHRDTTVVLTADHGEMLGERGLWYKMSFFEPSARVPLIVRPPGGGAARRVGTPVSLMDVAPTLLAWALGPDAVAEAGMDGESLAGALSENGARARGPVVCEFHAEGVTAPAAMIRHGAYKLVVCEGDPDQLYDLSADPLELVNLAGSPEHAAVVSGLRAELDSRIDLTDIARRVRQSQRERHLITRALAAGAPASWDYRPDAESRMRYVRSSADLYDLQRRARLESPGVDGAG